MMVVCCQCNYEFDDDDDPGGWTACRRDTNCGPEIWCWGCRDEDNEQWRFETETAKQGDEHADDR